MEFGGRKGRWKFGLDSVAHRKCEKWLAEQMDEGRLGMAGGWDDGGLEAANGGGIEEPRIMLDL